MLPIHFPDDFTAQTAAHIVLDLETLSTAPNAVVTSIGAVALNKYGQPIADGELHMALKLNHQITSRHTDINTIKWWEQQSQDAQAGSYAAQEHLRWHVEAALEAFSRWIHLRTDMKHVRVWGNGCSFDNVILASLYRDWHITTPWKFWNDRDMRTVTGLLPSVKALPFIGIKHHALDDARHEANQLSHAIQQLSNLLTTSNEAPNFTPA